MSKLSKVVQAGLKIWATTQHAKAEAKVGAAALPSADDPDAVLAYIRGKLRGKATAAKIA